MDSNIREIVHTALEENGASSLIEAYSKLKEERCKSTNDQVSTVSSDLFVLCAEAALIVRVISSCNRHIVEPRLLVWWRVKIVIKVYCSVV